MSFNTPKCKAYSRKIENGLWMLIGAVAFGLWCFTMFKLVEAMLR
ncbi:hypothetical protein FHR70_003781 [Microvirga lupini]|uniref:Uncharacterized protein n=1 Tax=Microvirga lupini TaxID=420324 RepID=A0A7W4VNZ2_9HYPH|nr:hypothetical protein [Microvirga lupini]MBB3020695.1 hypothetical protein [Microvirga lupini]